VNRPKVELISQKGGRRSTSLSRSHRQPLLFDAKYPLTSKNSPLCFNTLKEMSYKNRLWRVYTNLDLILGALFNEKVLQIAKRGCFPNPSKEQYLTFMKRRWAYAANRYSNWKDSWCFHISANRANRYQYLQYFGEESGFHPQRDHKDNDFWLGGGQLH
jgi:hypothetical protein